MLLIAAAALAVASCATISLEDLEFHAWKLKFGEKADSLMRFIRFLLLSHFNVLPVSIKLLSLRPKTGEKSELDMRHLNLKSDL